MDSHARNFEVGGTSRRRLPTIPQLRVAGATAVQHANDEYVGIFQQLVDGLQEQAALVDAETGTILAVNGAWQQVATLNGFADFRPGGKLLSRAQQGVRVRIRPGASSPRCRSRNQARQAPLGQDGL